MLRTSRSRASAARSPLGIRRANVSRVSRALTCVLLGFTVHSPALGIETGLEKCLNKTEKDQKLECIEDLARKRAARNAPGNYLDSTWRLAPDDTRLNIDDVQSYRPTYILLGHWTDNVNRQPTSPQLGHTVATPQAWNNDETKFQLSFKSELVSRETFGRYLGLDNFRLWFAYTQQSHWQVYNPRLSRPFRETNYEPEAILTVGTGNQGDGLKLINFGLVHQSNGRSLPESRSWNRIYAQGGAEWGRFSVLARAWYRLPEKPEGDDNPDIQKYLGRWDVVARLNLGHEWTASLLLRHSLGTNPSAGFVQFDLITHRMLGPARGYLQLTSGYGESLIDYNIRQTTFGVGVAYTDW